MERLKRLGGGADKLVKWVSGQWGRELLGRG